VMIAGWSGIGGVGVIAVDTIRLATVAEKFAEIAPHTFGVPFMPSSASLGFLKHAEFPTNSFYFHRTPQRDLIFFVGQACPRSVPRIYESGKLVLDIAERFQCKRIYVAGAAVSRVHHTTTPRIHAVTNQDGLMDEVRSFPNTTTRSTTDTDTSHRQDLFGLYNVVLEDAKRRGIGCTCLLGEIPMYISRFPNTPYPKASRPIVQVLTTTMGIELDLAQFDDLILPLEDNINKWVEKLPPTLKAEIDKLRDAARESGPITEEDKQKIMEDIDRFFKQ
jgi:uncharacterized protein